MKESSAVGYMKGLTKLGAIGLFSAFLFRLLNKASEMAEETRPYSSVRDAGPEYQQGIDAKDWDLVDEQSDESFPASDPPGNY